MLFHSFLFLHWGEWGLLVESHPIALTCSIDQHIEVQKLLVKSHLGCNRLCLGSLDVEKNRSLWGETTFKLFCPLPMLHFNSTSQLSLPYYLPHRSSSLLTCPSYKWWYRGTRWCHGEAGVGFEVRGVPGDEGPERQWPGKCLVLQQWIPHVPEPFVSQTPPGWMSVKRAWIWCASVKLQD